MTEELKNQARAILEGKRIASVEELKGLADQFQKNRDYGHARKLLELAVGRSPEDDTILLALALCTYQDEELLPLLRFSRALDILEKLGLGDPHKATFQILKLGGAIYKRKWEYDGQIESLYQALAFYRAAYAADPQQDKGYCGVNAAYILDILASRARAVARRSGTRDVESKQLEQQAAGLREQMLAKIPALAETDPMLKQDYWFTVTVAEIFFGLERYPEAGEWLARARSLDCRDWMMEATFRQLVSIARLRGCETPAGGSSRESWHPAWQALCEMFDARAECALSGCRGKTGLALSGGGFRASFFHIGVLARLAEANILKSVEVLSTVSGGSIVGALYYLKLRQLLRGTPDQEITRKDYIKIVKEIQQEFFAGVETNIRTSMFANFADNLRMLLPGKYGLSHRLGELYEQELYSGVSDDDPVHGPHKMIDLLISPDGWEGKEPFKPRYHNWRRGAKVPVLLLNATSLNTGHGWQFTARWMGEPPGLVGPEVDKNERYRRLYYDQALEQELRDYPLGYAVAASACVPGLFDPLVIDKLYPDRTVRLVDGGVCDNQGVEGLLDEHCTLIFCSDASGQMPDNRNPSGGVLGVLARSGSIQGDRVREAEYQDLRARLDTKALEGLFFIHLKKGLSVPPVDWSGCDDPTPQPTSRDTRTPYGIDAPLQRKLAAIRTDLDSFSEVEANSLMLSGYLMTDQELDRLQKQYSEDGGQGKWGGFEIAADKEKDWSFLQLTGIMSQSADSSDPRRQEIERQLEISRHRFFKVWRLDPVLQKLSWVGLGCAVLAVVAAAWHFRGADVLHLTLGELAVALLVVVAGLFFPVLNWLNPQQSSQDFVRKTALALLGYILVKVHIEAFDRRYLQIGSMNRLLGFEGDPGGTRTSIGERCASLWSLCKRLRGGNSKDPEH